MIQRVRNKVREYKIKKKVNLIVARYNTPIIQEYQDKGRILYDVTLSHHWLREGVMVGIVRTCNELYIALRKIAPIIMVHTVDLNGKAELHKVDTHTLKTTEEIIMPRKRDIFFTPELQIAGVHVPINHPAVGYLKKYGVERCAIIYDILPLNYPQYFEQDTAEGMAGYLISVLKNYNKILCISKTVCESVQDFCKTATIPPLNLTLNFCAEGNAKKHLITGWHGAETEHTWSSERSCIGFITCDIESDIHMTLQCRSFVNVGNTRIFINNHEIGEITENQDYQDYDFIIPAKFLNHTGIQNLIILTSGATSPLKLNSGNDSRILGIAVKKLKLKALNRSEKVIKNVISDPIKLGYFHCGTTAFQQIIKDGEASEVRNFISAAGKSNTYLMVGTVEPRKGHEFILQAFEALWNSGSNCCLCIIGRIGWEMDDFIKKMRNHERYGKSIMFFEAASDASLNYAYTHCAALIQASIDEGFGLPLIEAGQYGIPILCSDIPVFHEVAGEYVTYFKRDNIQSFIECFEEFNRMKEKGSLPDSHKIPYISWEESAKQIYDQIYDKTTWYGELSCQDTMLNRG